MDEEEFTLKSFDDYLEKKIGNDEVEKIVFESNADFLNFMYHYYRRGKLMAVNTEDNNDR